MAKAKVLTEAEIVKMPKSEYMNAAQLRFFRERLLDLQKQLRENAGATTEHLRELSFAPDPADRATLEEEHALELRTRDRERKLLKKIDQALAEEAQLRRVHVFRLRHLDDFRLGQDLCFCHCSSLLFVSLGAAGLGVPSGRPLKSP